MEIPISVDVYWATSPLKGDSEEINQILRDYSNHYCAVFQLPSDLLGNLFVQKYGSTSPFFYETGSYVKPFKVNSEGDVSTNGMCGGLFIPSNIYSQIQSEFNSLGCEVRLRSEKPLESIASKSSRIDDFLCFYENFLLNAYNAAHTSIESLNSRFDELMRHPDVTIYERNYILNQFIKLDTMDMYALPVLKSNYDLMKQNYEAYFDLKNESDILLTDINYPKLVQFTQTTWKWPYLGKISDHCGLDGNCVLYGPNRRLMMNTSIETMNPETYEFDGSLIFQCTFILDTGSGHNYLAQQTLEKLGLKNQKSCFNLLINGVKTEVNPWSEVNSKDVNILGMKFCYDSRMEFVMDFNNSSQPLLRFKLRT